MKSRGEMMRARQQLMEAIEKMPPDVRTLVNNRITELLQTRKERLRHLGPQEDKREYEKTAKFAAEAEEASKTTTAWEKYRRSR